MDDVEIVQRIGELADEEHRLERSHAGKDLSDEEHERLRAVEVALDQCWDLLRQRRARRSVGEDPDDASVRSADTVEHYKQ
jgi:hypothetical protein